MIDNNNNYTQQKLAQLEKENEYQKKKLDETKNKAKE